jgi:hypothetical protein
MARITLDADDLDQLTEAERDIVVLQLVSSTIAMHIRPN